MSLVCLGGGGAQKDGPVKLKQAGLNVITLPQTRGNNVALADVTLGFDTALGIAAEDVRPPRQHHAPPPSHCRGRDHGPSRWLADTGRGRFAGGADVILFPEVPYVVENITAAIRQRMRSSKGLSVVPAVAEGAMSRENAAKTAM